MAGFKVQINTKSQKDARKMIYNWFVTGLKTKSANRSINSFRLIKWCIFVNRTMDHDLNPLMNNVPKWSDTL